MLSLENGRSWTCAVRVIQDALRLRPGAVGGQACGMVLPGASCELHSLPQGYRAFCQGWVIVFETGVGDRFLGRFGRAPGS